MDKKERNEIALWLFDRVEQGRSEECGSMDCTTFNVGTAEITVYIQKDEDGNYPVWVGDVFASDFTIIKNATKKLICAALDLWNSLM